MATVEDALQTQLRNIATSTGRTIPEWTELIRTSGHARHREIVKWLQADHGLSYGSANRLALVSLAGGPAAAKTDGAAEAEGMPAVGDPLDQLYAGAKVPLRPIHDRLMAVIEGFGAPVEVAPKKGYVSLRRRTQFGMLKPAARRVDVGLILPDVPASARLEPAGSWNAMFTHRVRVGSVAEVDAELTSWLRAAWERAG